MTREQLLERDVRKAEQELYQAQARLLAHRQGPIVSQRMKRKERVISDQYRFIVAQMTAATPEKGVLG